MPERKAWDPGRDAGVSGTLRGATGAESSWAMARRDDDDVSRRYFEEEQRRHGPRGPARLARDFGDGTLGPPEFGARIHWPMLRSLRRGRAAAGVTSRAYPARATRPD